jgi:hypothetical protein
MGKAVKSWWLGLFGEWDGCDKKPLVKVTSRAGSKEKSVSDNYSGYRA